MRPLYQSDSSKRKPSNSKQRVPEKIFHLSWGAQGREAHNLVASTETVDISLVSRNYDAVFKFTAYLIDDDQYPTITNNRLILGRDFLAMYAKSMSGMHTEGHMYFLNPDNKAYKAQFQKKHISRYYRLLFLDKRSQSTILELTDKRKKSGEPKEVAAKPKKRRKVKDKGYIVDKNLNRHFDYNRIIIGTDDLSDILKSADGDAHMKKQSPKKLRIFSPRTTAAERSSVSPCATTPQVAPSTTIQDSDNPNQLFIRLKSPPNQQGRSFSQFLPMKYSTNKFDEHRKKAMKSYIVSRKRCEAKLEEAQKLITENIQSKTENQILSNDFEVLQQDREQLLLEVQSLQTAKARAWNSKTQRPHKHLRYKNDSEDDERPVLYPVVKNFMDSYTDHRDTRSRRYPYYQDQPILGLSPKEKKELFTVDIEKSKEIVEKYKSRKIEVPKAIEVEDIDNLDADALKEKLRESIDRQKEYREILSKHLTDAQSDRETN
ncbi:hypothetical protein V9T40_012691 [Parthenolecanium corni]|uniref:Uncharacterized protein n=1 Tax=Parthenolecanium corni TaxID=536013 RepID=A0AAN9Y0P1_9HEMI